MANQGRIERKAKDLILALEKSSKRTFKNEVLSYYLAVRNEEKKRLKIAQKKSNGTAILHFKGRIGMLEQLIKHLNETY